MQKINQKQPHNNSKKKPIHFPKLSNWSCFGIILVISFVVYSNTLNAAFHFDDFSSIVFNQSIKSLWNPASWLYFNPYRFVGYATFAINYAIHGLSVTGYHITNILIHAINGFLIYKLLILILPLSNTKHKEHFTENNIIILLLALIFVVHPLATEAVTYITQRLSSLATLFYVASLYSYIKFRFEVKEKNKIVFLILSVILSLLALFTKEIAITLPLAILLIEIFFIHKKKPFSKKALFVGFSSLAIIFILGILVFPWKKYLVTLPPLEGNNFEISPYHYVLTQCRVVVTYARLLFIPYAQCFDYDYALSISIFEIKTIFSLIALLVVAIAAIYKRKQYPLLSFGILWFLITLLPQSSIFPRPNIIFEHRAYISIVGFVFFVGGLLFETNLLRQIERHLIIFLSIYVLILGFLAYQRNAVYKTAYTLWSDCVQKSPQKTRVLSNMGQIMFQQGKHETALRFFNIAKKINPTYADIYFHRSRVHTAEKKYELALADLDSAVFLKPCYASAISNKGYIYTLLKNDSLAEVYFKQAIACDSSFASPYVNLATLYKSKSNVAEAINILSLGIMHCPLDEDLLDLRMKLFYEIKDYNRCKEDALLIIKINKRNKDAPAYLNRCN